MDRVRTRSPVYVRQKSVSSTASGASNNSPMMSPVHRHVRSGSTGISNFRRGQNNATKAAAQRLAQVMAHQAADSDDDDEDDSYDFNTSLTPSIGLSHGRGIRPRSPKLGRNAVEQSPSVRAISTGRPALAVKTVAMVPSTVPISLKPPSSTPLGTLGDSRREKRMSVDFGNFNAREISNGRSSSLLQDEGKEYLVVELLRHFSTTLKLLWIPDASLDMLQEENESVLQKLRLAEERCEEAEARARQLERQVASLGEVCSLFRKEAALQQREAALKAATQTQGVRNIEVTSLRLEAEAARDEATTSLEQLHESECEIKALRTMSQRMILTKEEMAAQVPRVDKLGITIPNYLCKGTFPFVSATSWCSSHRMSLSDPHDDLRKRWFSRGVGLHDIGTYVLSMPDVGVHPEIAGSKYEFWSSLAPLPLEVVLASGQKAKEENTKDKSDVEERDKILHDLNDLSGEGSIESMLLVEKGMRELASLKVEDAILLAMAQHRRPNSQRSGHSVADDLKLPIEGQNFVEAFELNHEESEDVLFKQAWLTYFWRRAKNHGLEQDIVDERLQFWINHGTRSPTSHDAVDGFERPSFEGFRLWRHNVWMGECTLLSLGRKIMYPINSPLRFYWFSLSQSMPRVTGIFIFAMPPKEPCTRFHGDWVASNLEALYKYGSGMFEIAFKTQWTLKPNCQFGETYGLSLFFNVTVERGLLELKKLGIENQLWQVTRRWIDPDGIFTRMQSDTDI
ncbi:hypothetical protein IFM89_037760 [Coptis chinensis]|uniref:Uncharacterized protein n=1 Tax=Coptis chinensis TaxID=261450 RepID=A0A835IT71_9MAGN|nr:hypothetical protein IFM89_037760 [Coptis chinensis]